MPVCVSDTTFCCCPSGYSMCWRNSWVRLCSKYLLLKLMLENLQFCLKNISTKFSYSHEKRRDSEVLTTAAILFHYFQPYKFLALYMTPLRHHEFFRRTFDFFLLLIFSCIRFFFLSYIFRSRDTMNTVLTYTEDFPNTMKLYRGFLCLYVTFYSSLSFLARSNKPCTLHM